MIKAPESLKHHDVDARDDAQLAREARDHLAASPALQFVSELLAELRARRLPWWTPDYLRGQYGARARMQWLEGRADVRQRITTGLTGFLPKAARRKDPDFQAALIDSAIEDGDVTIPDFEEAFDPRELAVYGPVADLWKRFRTRMPWGEDTAVHHELIGGAIKSLLAAEGDGGLTRTPILTAWDVRTSIPGRVWHTRMPLDIRVAIDDARFAQEQRDEGRPFLAKDDLAIALPAIMAKSIPLREFTKILDAAERAMGFEPTAPEIGRGLGAVSIAPPSLAPGSVGAPSSSLGSSASVASPVFDTKGGDLPSELLESPGRQPNDAEVWAQSGAEPPRPSSASMPVAAPSTSALHDGDRPTMTGASVVGEEPADLDQEFSAVDEHP